MHIRSLVRVLALVVLVSSLSACGDKDTGGTDTGSDIDYLFVQDAGGATLADGTLVLTGVAPSTIYFSDRPERIAGHVDTTAFVASWDQGDDSFADDPPNGALSILGDGAPDDIVVELSNPRLDGGTLTYDVKVLEGDASAQGKSCALFIDVLGRPATPHSVAGHERRVHRRHVRRAVRR